MKCILFNIFLALLFRVVLSLYLPTDDTRSIDAHDREVETSSNELLSATQIAGQAPYVLEYSMTSTPTSRIGI